MIAVLLMGWAFVLELQDEAHVLITGDGISHCICNVKTESVLPTIIVLMGNHISH